MQRWMRHAIGLGVLSLAVFAAAPDAYGSERDDARFAVADVAEDVLPAVVSIRTTQEFDIEDLPAPLRFFYSLEELPDEVRQGEGSGVILREDGLVVTNNHVVADADEVYVQTHDGTEYVAEVLASDAESDLALIQLSQEDGSSVSQLPTLQWGESDQLRLGEVVLAVGNPFGLSGTVTMGIVSAKGRETEAYTPFIQTDAAINPGNSGGALVNMDGRLVGINTQILSRSGGSLGIGFAIPSDFAERVVEDLLNGGKVAKGWLGVHIQDLSPELADAWGYDDAQRGVLLTHIEDGSPAAQAGLKRSDLVTHIGEIEVDDTGTLARTVGRLEPGSEVAVHLLRKGKAKTVPVVLGERPGAEQMAKSDAPSESQAERMEDLPVLEGLELASLNADLRARYNLGKRSGSVVVTGISPRTPASRARLEEGDVILEVDNQPVRSPTEVRRALSDPMRAVLLIARGEQTFFVMLRTDPAGR